MTILARIRAKKCSELSQRERDFYTASTFSSGSSIAAWQLERLNQCWSQWISFVPGLQADLRRGAVPGKLESLEQFSELLPTMDKAEIRLDAEKYIDASKKPELWKFTGGTTSEPFKIPQWRSEIENSQSSIWFARRWYGIQPDDRLFLIWGHSHLLGGGLRGWVNARKRTLQDRALGYYRHSAYALGESDMRQAGAAFLGFNPAYLMGYSVALARFAKFNQNRKAEFHKLKLKCVIATGESFANEADRALIESVFGCKVHMEYGAVETGPLANEIEAGKFAVFWRHYLVETVQDKHGSELEEISVTSLYPRSLPLIRYRLGDLTSKGVTYSSDGVFLGPIQGRCNDFIKLPEGKVVHSEAVTHVVRDIPGIQAFQLHQDRSGKIDLFYEASKDLPSHHINEVRRRFSKIDPVLASLDIQRTELIKRTIAGKTRTIVSELARSEA